VILANCTNITIKNYNFNRCYVGIELGFSSYNDIINNNVANNPYGIYLYQSDSNNIINDIIASSHIYGIRLGQSHNNNISNNDVSNNIDGIYLSYSNKNSIIGNRLFENGDPYAIKGMEKGGIKLESSSKNHIYYNELVDNIYQALDDRNDNFWDNGYPFGGNYWADYFWGWYKEYGHDDFKGPNQNIPGGDGLGDSPYIIDSNSRDTYPLMKPNTSPYNLNSAPIANAGSNQTVYTNESVHFSGLNSDDPGGEILVYSWNFGDGSPLGQGINTTHIYNLIGVYIVSLTIRDNEGFIDTDHCVVTVIHPPSANYFHSPIYLVQGWNFVSFPTIQNKTDIQTVMQLMEGKYDALQWYNNNDKQDPWRHKKIEKSFGNDFFKINLTMGLFIHITQPGSTLFLYNGTLPSKNTHIHLLPGWNMVGYPSLDNKNRTAALNNLVFETQIDAISSFDAATQSWKQVGENGDFEVGKGYWMHAKTECTWEVPL
jgi:parallel beta-helix repeat protein